MQGDAGEASAVSWVLSRGGCVFVPVAHTPSHYDLIVDLDGDVLRVQVKTCSRWDGRRYSVMLCTRGGNQSWNGLVKKLDPLCCDYAFIHVGDGRRWFIPSAEVGGGTAIVVGGPKYAAFEVERGAPLPARERATEYTSAPPAG
jgi:hypothetical protein